MDLSASYRALVRRTFSASAYRGGPLSRDPPRQPPLSEVLAGTGCPGGAPSRPTLPHAASSAESADEERERLAAYLAERPALAAIYASNNGYARYCSIRRAVHNSAAN